MSAVHTSAQGTPVMEYTGTLLHQAEARTKVLDGQGHTVPVLCMDIELDNALHTPMHVEQPFPAASHEQARAAAHRFKRGMRVTVQAPLVSVRLGATASHIHVIPDQQEEISCPQ